MNKIENIDFSDIGFAGNQEYMGNDYSQDKSFLQQLRNENQGGSNNNSAVAFHSTVGQNSSPFSGYLSEKGYVSQYSTGGKNFKVNIAELASTQQFYPQHHGQKMNHTRYSSSVEPNQGSGSLNNTLKSFPKNSIPLQQDPRNISQNNFRNLKNTAISNSPISPSK
jgi:hypothetical protein